MNETVTITASLTGLEPGPVLPEPIINGTVVFYDNNLEIGRNRTVLNELGDAGVTSIKHTFSSAGNHFIRVYYTGDSGNSANNLIAEVNVINVQKTEIRGDINRNGELDTGDVTLILRSIVGLPIPSEYMPLLPMGDMNCNDRLDTGDVTLILREVVNLPISRCWSENITTLVLLKI